MRHMAEDIPLQRIGTPEDVADVVTFFASDQARWVTGQALHVGDGHVMWPRDARWPPRDSAFPGKAASA